MEENRKIWKKIAIENEDKYLRVYSFQIKLES